MSLCLQLRDKWGGDLPMRMWEGGRGNGWWAICEMCEGADSVSEVMEPQRALEWMLYHHRRHKSDGMPVSLMAGSATP